LRAVLWAKAVDVKTRPPASLPCNSAGTPFGKPALCEGSQSGTPSSKPGLSKPGLYLQQSVRHMSLLKDK